MCNIVGKMKIIELLKQLTTLYLPTHHPPPQPRHIQDATSKENGLSVVTMQ